MESILIDVKKDLGIDKDDKSFDLDIIRRINSILSTLRQLGVGPKDGYRITNEYDTWDKLLQGRTDIEDVKDYVYMRVRLRFDPPTSSTLLAALKEEIKEVEWRLNVQVETPNV